MTSDAQEAWDEGAPLFTAVLNYPTMNTGNNAGNAVWSSEISGVVAIGWKLQSWAVAPDRRDNFVAFPVFTR
jgi:hypothetical protein